MAQEPSNIPTPHADEAFDFLVQSLRKGLPLSGGPGGARYDVWLPTVFQFYLQTVAPRFTSATGFKMEREIEGVSRAFYDAAWRLCRMGIVRPTVIWTAVTGTHQPAAGDGYSLTVAGREWIKKSELVFVPTDPNRYLSSLEKQIPLLGRGFAQRAGEAASCHQTANYLACCAMCGAAAESAILAVAIAKSGDEAKVLMEYKRPTGRSALIRRVFGKAPANSLRQRFMQSAIYLLAYWRDESAHGVASEISELQAYNALILLFRLASYFSDEWNSLIV